MQVNTVSPSLVVALTSAPARAGQEKKRREEVLNPCEVLLPASWWEGRARPANSLGMSLTSFQEQPDVLRVIDLHPVAAGQGVEQGRLSCRRKRMMRRRGDQEAEVGATPEVQGKPLRMRQ